MPMFPTEVVLRGTIWALCACSNSPLGSKCLPESRCLQVLTKASLALAMLAFAGVLVISLVVLGGKGVPVGYTLPQC